MTADVLCDTSVAIALVVEGHDHHATTMQALDGRVLGLAGHAWFETYSVLTRLPAPSRRAPSEVAEILMHNFPDTRFLDAEKTAAVVAQLPGVEIAGGAVYDALVAAAAAAHGLALATRDRRAMDTYLAMGTAIELLD